MNEHLTVKQIEALNELVQLAQAHHVEIRNRADLTIQYLPEARPGRGHDIQVHYIDGDHALTEYIDVYGNGSGAHIAELTWIHSGSDDGGYECEFCPDDANDEEFA